MGEDRMGWDMGALGWTEAWVRYDGGSMGYKDDWATTIWSDLAVNSWM
jgi:hypothetical protein